MKVTANTDRRAAIGDAAIRIVARDGLRSLTHRAVDRELGLPSGSTSYYTRTRRELIELMVHRLAGRTMNDMGTAGAGAPGPGRTPRGPETAEAGIGDAPATVANTAAALAALIDRLALRADDHRARYALAVDLVDDPALHAVITGASPVRARMLTAAADRLGRLGVPDPPRHAAGLVALVDGLLFDRVAGSGRDPASRPDAETVIRAYLQGLLAR